MVTSPHLTSPHLLSLWHRTATPPRSTCSTPLCDVAKQLAQEGFDVTAPTIGFLTSAAGSEEFACVAAVSCTVTVGGTRCPIMYLIAGSSPCQDFWPLQNVERTKGGIRVAWV